MGVGASISLKFRPLLVDYFDGLSAWSRAGNKADLSTHRRQLSSRFLAFTTFLFFFSFFVFFFFFFFFFFFLFFFFFVFHGRGQRDVGAASQWLISRDVQPDRLHSVEHPPRPSVTTFQAAPESGVWLCLEPL